MEVPTKYLFVIVIVIIVLVYLLYLCGCKNAVLCSKLGENKEENSIVKNIAKKGVKAFASSNNLEEIPKFL